MENIQAIHLLELIHLDHHTVEATEGRKEVHVLEITDCFMQYAQALMTSSKTAKCTAQALWDKFIVYYGLPTSTSSDQGHNFESHLVAELWHMAKV